jgi:hypothetical protein
MLEKGDLHDGLEAFEEGAVLIAPDLGLEDLLCGDHAGSGAQQRGRGRRTERFPTISSQGWWRKCVGSKHTLIVTLCISPAIEMVF